MKCVRSVKMNTKKRMWLKLCLVFIAFTKDVKFYSLFLFKIVLLLLFSRFLNVIC